MKYLNTNIFTFSAFSRMEFKSEDALNLIDTALSDE